MTIVTRRTLIVPYTEAVESDFLMLNCCATNRAQMNGPKTVASAKQLFQQVLHDPHLHAMAVMDNHSREYMGHVFVQTEKGKAELGFIFDKAYWGRGLASEVLNAFFPQICQRLNLSRVSASTNLDHYASIAILHKLGFHLVGTFEDVLGPYYEYAWLPPERATTSDGAAGGRPEA